MIQGYYKASEGLRRKMGISRLSTKLITYDHCTRTPDSIFPQVFIRSCDRKGIIQERERTLHDDTGKNNSRHNPVAGVPTNLKSCRGTLIIVSTTGSSCTIGQCTVDNQVSGAIYIRNSDHRLIQCSVATVTNEIVKVLRIIVLVTAARVILLAKTCDWKCCVRAVRIGLIGISSIVESILRVVSKSLMQKSK